MKSGSEITYEWVAGLLRDGLPADGQTRLGLEAADAGAFLLRFLGRTYRIDKNGVGLVGQTIAWSAGSPGDELDIKSVLGYYALSKAPGLPAGEYCLFSHFSGGVFRESEGAFSALNKRVAAVFGGGPHTLKGVLERLGAAYEPSARDGKHIWRYRLLPALPARWVFYEGDDEFPSALQILYDKSAIPLFNFEQLAVLHSVTMRAILSMGA